MKTFKKTTVLLLVLAIISTTVVVVLAGCTGNYDIIHISDTGNALDGYYNEAIWTSIQEYGANNNMTAATISSLGLETSDFHSTISKCVENYNAKYIVCASPTFREILTSEFCEQYPNTTFIYFETVNHETNNVVFEYEDVTYSEDPDYHFTRVYDSVYSYPVPSNVICIQFDQTDLGYAAGYAAAQMGTQIAFFGSSATRPSNLSEYRILVDNLGNPVDRDGNVIYKKDADGNILYHKDAEGNKTEPMLETNPDKLVKYRLARGKDDTYLINNDESSDKYNPVYYTYETYLTEAMEDYFEGFQNGVAAYAIQNGKNISDYTIQYSIERDYITSKDPAVSTIDYNSDRNKRAIVDNMIAENTTKSVDVIFTAAGNSYNSKLKDICNEKSTRVINADYDLTTSDDTDAHLSNATILRNYNAAIVDVLNNLRGNTAKYAKGNMYTVSGNIAVEYAFREYAEGKEAVVVNMEGITYNDYAATVTIVEITAA